MNIFVLVYYINGVNHTVPIQTDLTWDKLYHKLSSRSDSLNHILTTLNISYGVFDFELYELDEWLRNCYVIE